MYYFICYIKILAMKERISAEYLLCLFLSSNEVSYYSYDRYVIE